MNQDKLSGTLSLTPVTPVHIGSGEVYTGLDYAIRDGHFEVKDVRAFFEAQRDNVQFALDAVEQGLDLGPEFVRYRIACFSEQMQRGAPKQTRPDSRPAAKGTGKQGLGGRGPKLDPRMAKLMRQSEKRFGKSPDIDTQPRDRATGEVRAFIKDPFGMPFIPATSVKGALRTALACHLAQYCRPGPGQILARELDRKPNRQWAFKGVNEAVFGAKVIEDLLKALIIRDSAPIRLTGGFAVSQVKIMNVFQDRFEEKRGVPIHTEALMPGSGPFTLPFHVDLFRLREDKALAKPLNGKGAALLRGPQALEDAIREHGRALARYEAAFYKDQNQPAMAGLFTGWQGDSAMYLPVGFGTGWHTKTIGRVLDDRDLEQIRRTFRLGRERVPVFPKTRKWAKSPQGWQPMGWLKVEIIWK